MFDFFKTPTEKKRDDYHKLYEKLKDRIQMVKTTVSEIETGINSYTGSVPDFSNTKVPSKDFDVKREGFTDDLKRYFSTEKGYKADLTSAKDAAKAKYEECKQLAIKEAEIKAAKEAAERERVRLERERGDEERIKAMGKGR
ncbi:hypothetical protein [Pseudolactococcus raffinolactis]|uniref:hypothetical protein n=1 Tax=Pseudolactococcus raffinolactis TaxID=1366 RepID=UPI002415C0D6|nr:hypothetical protein [Lactococcus raffinolactis]MDG4961541.1 hypothetical protein [Lactococcus raffinolactis]